MPARPFTVRVRALPGDKELNDSRDVQAERVGQLFVHRAVTDRTRWTISAPTGIALTARVRTRATARRVARTIQERTSVDWSQATDLKFTSTLDRQTVDTIRTLIRHA